MSEPRTGKSGHFVTLVAIALIPAFIFFAARIQAHQDFRDFLSSLMLHISAALAIALAVNFLVDRQQRRRDEMYKNQQLQESLDIAHHVRSSGEQALSDIRGTAENSVKHISDSAQAEIKKFAVDVSEVMANRQYSEKVLAEVKREILDKALARRNFTHRVFASVAERAGSVSFVHEITYELFNTSYASQAYTPEFTFDSNERFFASEQFSDPRIQSVTINGRSLEIGQIAALNAALEQCNRRGDGLLVTRLEEVPIEVSQSCWISYSVETIEPSAWFWTTRCFLPVLAPELEWCCAEDLELSVSLITLASDEFQELATSRRGGMQVRRWRHNGVIMPQSGWTFRWHQ